MSDRSAQSISRHTYKGISAAACLIAVSLVIASQVPPLEQYAALMWGLAILAFAGAALAARRSHRRESGISKRSLGITIAAFTVAAVAATATVRTSPDIAPDFSGSLATQAQQSTTAPLELPSIVTVNNETSEAAATDFAGTQVQFQTVGNEASQKIVTQAQELGYIPASGLEQDFNRAVVEKLGGDTVVTVPLEGTNLQEMTKVSYVSAGGVVQVTEMAAEILDDTHASFQMWRDKNLVKDVVLYDPAASAGNVVQAGLNWSKLNSCLSNAGVSGWIMAMIGVACAAACATAVACVPCIAAAAGFGSGTIGACVQLSWD